MNPCNTAGQLRRAGLPAHPRYEATLRVFLAWPCRSMTVEEVYGELLKADARVNFVGIYRIVHRLCDTGFLRQIGPPQNQGRAKCVFMLRDGERPHALAHEATVSRPDADVRGLKG